MPDNLINYKTVLAASDEIFAKGIKPTTVNVAEMLGVSPADDDLKMYIDRWAKNIVNKSVRTIALFEGEGSIDERVDHVSGKTDELENALAVSRSILNSTSDAILVVTCDNRFVDINKQFIDMWSIPQEYLDTGDEQATFQHVIDHVTDPELLFKEASKFYDDPELRYVE